MARSWKDLERRLGVEPRPAVLSPLKGAMEYGDPTFYFGSTLGGWVLYAVEIGLLDEDFHPTKKGKEIYEIYLADLPHYRRHGWWSYLEDKLD